MSFLLFSSFAILLNSLNSIVGFLYGQHFPNGNAAVKHIYGEKGTWKSFTPLNYKWNYYQQYETSNHPYDKEKLIAAANGSAFFTARDANGYLLCDPDHDLEINAEYCINGRAFHEHNGIQEEGIQRGNPFTQFWFDDNWLARYMSQAYEMPEPIGLTEQFGFLRWKVLGGDTSNWTPYNQNYFDTLALDGLYYLLKEDVPSAISQWDKSMLLSKAVWNSTTRTYDYPEVHENYHMGLWLTLTRFLLDNSQLSQSKSKELLQHSVSLRKNIIKNQGVDIESGKLIGWVSNIGSGTSLINTESVSCNVLGLGANSRYVFEFLENFEPFQEYVLSYQMKNSTIIQTKGPSFPLPTGNFIAEIVLRPQKRFENNNAVLGYFRVLDNNNSIIAEMTLRPSHFGESGDWSKISLPFETRAFPFRYDFILEWKMEFGDVDISAVFIQ